MNTQEQQFLHNFIGVATPHVARALGIKECDVPWMQVLAPSTIRQLAGKDLPLYIAELNPAKIDAGRLVSHKHVLHNISTTFGDANIYWKNSVGVGLVYDPRPKPKVDVLQAVLGGRTSMIVGRGRSGKTTLLQYIIASGKYEQIFVFDPKPLMPNEGDKWLAKQHNVTVYGRREDYPGIEQGLDEIVAVMGKGGYGHRVLVLIDEFWITCSFVDVSLPVFRMVTLGGEPMIDVIIGTHSDRVKGLGIEGQGDLRDGFESVVRLKKTGDRHMATVEFAGEVGQHTGILPGPFSLPEPEPKLTQPPKGPRLEDFRSATGTWVITTQYQRCLVRWGIRANN